MGTYIAGISHFFPRKKVTNECLAKEFPEWGLEKIQSKTGIYSRYIADDSECATDLAVKAVGTLLNKVEFGLKNVDFLLYCTQTPDYLLPTSACLLQDRLGLSKGTACLDFNLGCSGYVYGLSLAKALIESGQAKCLLLVCADTYSKLLRREDKGVRSIFGDAATATLLRQTEDDVDLGYVVKGPFVLGTDGSGAQNLIVRGMGMRTHAEGKCGNISDKSKGFLHMNGPEIFNFTLDIVPSCVSELLKKANLTLDEVDKFVMHQANHYMLEHLRKKIGIPKDKFVYSLINCGNTVSSTIPIALEDIERQGTMYPGQVIMVVGFGVGYSWGGAILEWK